MQYEWDARRNLTEYEYDLAGKREAVIRYLDGRAIRHEYTYYPNGELHTDTDALDHTTTYSINALDQPGRAVASVTRLYQINVNMVHKWRRELSAYILNFRS